MSETARTGYLIREGKKKVKTMFLMDIICIKSPFGQVCGSLSLLHTAGTERVQFGYSYAETASNERSELYGDFGR